MQNWKQVGGCKSSRGIHNIRYSIYIYICIAPDLLSKQPEYIKLMLDLPRSRIID